MWNLCLKRLSVVILSRRASSTGANSIIANAIKHLAVDYRKELDQLQRNESESVPERIQYLRTTLQTMTKRDRILQDIDETKKLSDGNTTSVSFVTSVISIVLESVALDDGVPSRSILRRGTTLRFPSLRC